MDKFDQKIFDFLIQEENFEFAYEIYELFPEVRDKLIEDFWKSVKHRLQKLVNDTIWEVKFWESNFSAWWKLGLFLNSGTEDIRVIYEKLQEKPYYGLWLDMETDELDRSKIIDYMSSVEILQHRGGYDGKYWFGREEIGDDFQSYRTLKKILPKNREVTVNEYSQLLYEFAVELSDEVQKMSEFIKDS